MTRFFLDPICMTLLIAESIKNRLKSKLPQIRGRKLEFRTNSNIVQCIHIPVEEFTFHEVLYDSRLSWAFLLVFCRLFGFISVLAQFSFIYFYYWNLFPKSFVYGCLEPISFDFYFVLVCWLLYDVESGCGELWDGL